MYPLAVALSIPVVVLTATIPLWGAWQIAQNVVSGDDALAWGLNVPGLMVLAFALSLVLWKFAAPALAGHTWPSHRTTAAIFMVTWVGAIAASAGIVSLSGGTFLSRSIFGSISALQDSQASRVWIASLCWLLLDAIVSLLPTALTNAAAWRRMPMIGNANRTTTPAPHLQAKQMLGGLALLPPVPAEDRLARLLESIAAGPSGEVCWGVRLECDGTIVTSQGALAALLNVSKSTINRALELLSKAGCITVCCSARETRIALIEP